MNYLECSCAGLNLGSGLRQGVRDQYMLAPVLLPRWVTGLLEFYPICHCPYRSVVTTRRVRTLAQRSQAEIFLPVWVRLSLPRLCSFYSLICRAPCILFCRVGVYGMHGVTETSLLRSWRLNRLSQGSSFCVFRIRTPSLG